VVLGRTYVSLYQKTLKKPKKSKTFFFKKPMFSSLPENGYAKE